MNGDNNTVWGIVGCGWLGQKLAEELVQEGNEVHGTTRSIEKLAELDRKGIKGHLLSLDSLEKEADWFAKLNVLVLNIPPSQVDNYVSGMKAICAQLNPSTHVILISSTSVYPDLNDVVNEDSRSDGENRNGPIVRETEVALMDLLGDRLTILRMAGLIGGDRNPVKYFSGRMVKNGASPVNLVHREDCIGVIRRVVECSCWAEIINVCATDHPTRKDYYEEAARKLGLSAPQFDTEKKSFKIVDNSKSKKLLNYHYKFDSPFDFP